MHLSHTCDTGAPIISWRYHLSSSNGSWCLKVDTEPFECYEQTCSWPSKLSRMDFNVVYRTGIEYQAIDELWQLPTAAEDQTPTNDVLLVMPVSSRPKRWREETHKRNDVTNDCDDADTNDASPVFPTVCQISTSREHTTTPSCATSAPASQKRFLPTSGLQNKYTWLVLLVRLSWHVVESLNDAVQTVVPDSCRPRLLYLTHYAKWPDSVERQMYNTRRCDIYWSHRANEVYTTVSDCCECTLNQAALKKMHYQNLFPTSRPMELVAMDTFDLLAKTTTANQFVIVITDQYPKISSVYLVTKNRERYVSSILFDQWV